MPRGVGGAPRVAFCTKLLHSMKNERMIARKEEIGYD